MIHNRVKDNGTNGFLWDTSVTVTAPQSIIILKVNRKLSLPKIFIIFVIFLPVLPYNNQNNNRFHKLFKLCWKFSRKFAKTKNHPTTMTKQCQRNKTITNLERKALNKCRKLKMFNFIHTRNEVCLEILGW
jgi:hypothetical protein